MKAIFHIGFIPCLCLLIYTDDSTDVKMALVLSIALIGLQTCMYAIDSLKHKRYLSNVAKSLNYIYDLLITLSQSTTIVSSELIPNVITHNIGFYELKMHYPNGDIESIMIPAIYSHLFSHLFVQSTEEVYRNDVN